MENMYHIRFSDDFIFFCRASMKSFVALNDILCDFTDFEVNHSQCVNDVDNLDSILGFLVKSLPMQYLGVPITRKAIAYKYCQSLNTDYRRY